MISLRIKKKDFLGVDNMAFYAELIRVVSAFEHVEFLGLKSPVLKFLNFLSSRVLLGYKPLTYQKSVLV